MSARPLRSGAVAAITAALLLAVAAPSSAYVYWGNGSAIARATLAGGDVTSTWVALTRPTFGLAVNSTHIYWVNGADGAIGRVSLDGVTGFTGTLRSIDVGARGVALDAAHLYWANSGVIGQSDLDGGSANPSFITAPAMAVAVGGGHIYWAGAAIGRADLDGSNVNSNLVTGPGLVVGMAVDATHIYWTDVAGGTINRADLDGGNVTHLITGLTSPSDVALDATHLYWTSANGIGNMAVGRANLDGTAPQTTWIADTGMPGGLAVDGLPDTTPPDTAIDSGPSGLTNDPTPTFTFSSTETGSTFECRVDSAAFTACTSPHTTAALADGAHTFQVRATDAAHNTDATPAQRSLTVDTTPPDTTIDSGPSATTSDATPTFTFSSTETGSTFECRVDGAAFTACTSPFTTAALADGAHTFQVRATDPAGNVETEPAGSLFTVDTAVPDTTAPDTTIDSGPTGTTDDSTPTFTFSSSEAGSTFECSVDGATFAACTSPHTTAALADGAHGFRVRAIDAAHNADPTPAERSFTVSAVPIGPSDTTAPRAVVSAKSRQRAAGPIVVVISRASETATATVSATLAVPGTKGFKLRAVTRKLAAGGKATVRLRVSAAARKAALRAIARHRKVRAKITVKLRDTAGNAATVRRTISLRR